MKLPVRRFMAALPVMFALTGFAEPAKLAPEQQAEVTAWLRSVAEKTMIERIEFKEADISEVLAYLRKKSVENSPEKDPDKAGIGFINRCTDGAKPVTISLTNVSLWDAIHKVCAAAQVAVSVEGYKFVIDSHENHLIARATRVDRMRFDNDDIWHCVAYLRKKSIDNSPEKDQDRRGINFISMVVDGAKPVTLDLKGVTILEAIEAVAGAAGVEVSNDGCNFIFHEKGRRPVVLPANAFENSPLWKRASGMVIDRVVFVEADAAEACVFLKRKSKEVDNEKKGVDLSAEGDFVRKLTIDLRNVRVTDVLRTFAEVGGAEITVSGGKIILKPAKKTD